MKYYYSIDGTEVVGPYPIHELEDYFATGALPRSTQICAEGTQAWQPITATFDSLVKSQSQPQLKQPQIQSNQLAQSTASPSPIHSMNGVQDVIEVYSDKICITPRGILGFLNKGMKGTKTIPFTSIMAIQYREAGKILSGFIQFTILGGNESKGGIFAATKDENSFIFKAADGGNKDALRIKNYVETEVQKLRIPSPKASISLSDELQKLAALKAQGLLSDSEFDAAKKRLLG